MKSTADNFEDEVKLSPQKLKLVAEENISDAPLLPRRGSLGKCLLMLNRSGVCERL